MDQLGSFSCVDEWSGLRVPLLPPRPPAGVPPDGAASMQGAVRAIVKLPSAVQECTGGYPASGLPGAGEGGCYTQRVARAPGDSGGGGVPVGLAVFKTVARP